MCSLAAKKILQIFFLQNSPGFPPVSDDKIRARRSRPHLPRPPRRPRSHKLAFVWRLRSEGGGQVKVLVSCGPFPLARPVGHLNPSRVPCLGDLDCKLHGLGLVPLVCPLPTPGQDQLARATPSWKTPGKLSVPPSSRLKNRDEADEKNLVEKKTCLFQQVKNACHTAFDLIEQ